MGDLSTQLAGTGPLAEQIAALPTMTDLQSVEEMAAAARDIAVINSATYPDEATGRAAVADGAYFKVAGSGDVAFREYRRIDASTSVLAATYPSKDYIDSGNAPAGTAMTASGAGYETINPDAPGYDLATITPDRVTITKGTVGSPITITKTAAATGSLPWFGVHLKIPYAALSDLDKLLSLNLTVVAGVSANTAYIVTDQVSWYPGPNTVALNVANLKADGLNLYDAITAAGKTSVYAAQSYLYVTIGYWAAAYATVNAATATWTMQPRFDSALDVIANKITPDLVESLGEALQTAEVATAVLQPKAPLGAAGFTKLDSGSIAALVKTYSRQNGSGTVNIGYDFDLSNVSASGYSYFRTKLFDDYATQAADKTYRAFVKSDGKATAVYVRWTSGPAWGSEDGSVAQYKSTLLTLHEGNGYQATVDIDYADAAAFYAAAGRNQVGYLIVAFDDQLQTDTVQFSVYCLDISPSTSGVEGDMEAGSISKLPSVDALQADVDALQADVAELKSGAAADTYITCWGDSLTAQGGWTAVLETLTGLAVYNAGTGGETSRTIMARQGADAMVVNNITIPAATTPVLIASRAADWGIKTASGAKATPLLQGGSGHVNPCRIGDVEGTLAWTGANYADENGTWTFTRSAAGSEVVIDRPTALRTAYDMHRNGGIQIIFMGTNGGYADVDDLVWQHKMMIAHAGASHNVIIGMSTGSAAERAAYEAAMRTAFGRYFVSLREYLATPIYAADGTTIVSSYGLDDAGLTPTQADLDATADGEIAPQLTVDGVHYAGATKTVIGNMLGRVFRDLNIL
ncbi:hypothetical protein CKO11_07010 [Rhodobacter sp. TJ_12]|nr:hypothetical protein [Rhodobacter sp. TJ_12]